MSRLYNRKLLHNQVLKGRGGVPKMWAEAAEKLDAEADSVASEGGWGFNPGNTSPFHSQRIAGATKSRPLPPIG